MQPCVCVCVCVCVSTHASENENRAVHKDTLGWPSALFCCLFVYHWRTFSDLRPQHQQQVVQAMERAKQVTMGELNASIGVRGLPPLPLTVCTSIFSSFLFNTFLLSCHCRFIFWIQFGYIFESAFITRLRMCKTPYFWNRLVIWIKTSRLVLRMLYNWVLLTTIGYIFRGC